MSFEEAKSHQAQLEAESNRTGSALKALSGGGPMGMTSDAARATPAWKSAKRTADAAFADLRAFNAGYVRRYKKEIAEDRRLRRQGGGS